MRKDQVICCFFWGHGQLLGHVALHVVAHGNPSPMTPVGSIYKLQKSLAPSAVKIAGLSFGLDPGRGRRHRHGTFHRYGFTGERGGQGF